MDEAIKAERLKLAFQFVDRGFTLKEAKRLVYLHFEVERGLKSDYPGEVDRRFLDPNHAASEIMPLPEFAKTSDEPPAESDEEIGPNV